MAAPLNPTLQELRTKLRDELGFGGQSEATGPQTGILNGFIRRAENKAYKEVSWKRLRQIVSIDVGINQQYFDYPETLNPERIIKLAASGAVTTGASGTVTMTEGIEESHYNMTKNGGNSGYDKPIRYELRDQIEIWPIMDHAGTAIKVEGIKRLGVLSANSDRLTVYDDELVFNLALAHAKAHYNHKDARDQASFAQSLLNDAKAENAKKKRYRRRPDRPKVYREPYFNPTILDHRR